MRSSTTVILLNHVLFVIHDKCQIPPYSTAALPIPHPKAVQVFSPFGMKLCTFLTEKHLDFQAFFYYVSSIPPSSSSPYLLVNFSLLPLFQTTRPDTLSLLDE